MRRETVRRQRRGRHGGVGGWIARPPGDLPVRHRLSGGRTGATRRVLQREAWPATPSSPLTGVQAGRR